VEKCPASRIAPRPLSSFRRPPPAHRHLDQRDTQVLVTRGLDPVSLGKRFFRETACQVEIDDAPAPRASGQEYETAEQAAKRHFDTVGQQGHQSQ
jgi:hypothetical protein